MVRGGAPSRVRRGGSYRRAPPAGGDRVGGQIRVDLAGALECAVAHIQPAGRAAPPRGAAGVRGLREPAPRLAPGDEPDRRRAGDRAGHRRTRRPPRVPHRGSATPATLRAGNGPVRRGLDVGGLCGAARRRARRPAGHGHAGSGFSSRTGRVSATFAPPSRIFRARTNQRRSPGVPTVDDEVLDWPWFMHSTDRFSDPDAVASVVEALSGHGPVRDLWGYGKNNLVGLDGKPLFPRPYGYMPFKMRKFLLGATVAHQATFFGASLVAKLGGYDLDFGLEADQLFIYRAALIRPSVTIDRVVCDFDVTGPGSTQPIREHYRTLRRLWDLHGDYPLGGRRVSWAYLRVKEYLIRADLAAFNAVKFLRAKFARASRKQNS
uniref:Gsa protein n=1 Tax=Mycobacterium avium TaxID=1764 RepID=Q9L426_MYCAV|nr:Gsa protein [Mycobacterium avium subsp. paratuberculosis]